jgi:hypothetical protein
MSKSRLEAKERCFFPSSQNDPFGMVHGTEHYAQHDGCTDSYSSIVVMENDSY